MLLLFVFTGSAVTLLVLSFLIAEAREAVQGRSRGTRSRASTGRWRYEAVQHK